MWVAALALAGLAWLGEPAPPPSQPAEPDPYRSARDQLAQAVALADADPRSIAPLEQALAALPDFAPQLAADPEGLALRTRAQLAVARAHLLAGDMPRAKAAMDEAIRAALGAPLPIDPADAALTQLWRARAKFAQAHPGRPLVVECSVPCRVYLDEREVPPDLPAVPEGMYRLWVEADDGQLGPLRSPVAMTGGEGPGLRGWEEPLTIPYRTAEAAPAKPEPDLVVGGLIILGVGGGIGLLGVTGFAVGLAREPKTLAVCYAMCSIGGAVMTIGGVLTGVGLHRRGRTGPGRFLRRGVLAPSVGGLRRGAQLGLSLRF